MEGQRTVTPNGGSAHEYFMPQAAASDPSMGASRRRLVTVTVTVPAEPLPQTSPHLNASDDQQQTRRRRHDADPTARSSDSSEHVTISPTATAQQAQVAQPGVAVSSEASSPEASPVQSYTAALYGPLAPPAGTSFPGDRPLYSLDGHMDPSSRQSRLLPATRGNCGHRSCRSFAKRSPQRTPPRR